MDLKKYLSNPTVGRIMQYLFDGKEHTTKDIAEYLSDVPVPTIYRHINYLIKNDIVVVKEERKVRGSRERILAPNLEWSKTFRVSEASYPFIMELMNRFERYSQTHLNYSYRDMYDKDRLFLGKVVVYLDDDEMDGFIKELEALEDKYIAISEESKSKKGKLRNINIISAPGEFE
jgi:DNA-binding transcriptional ArsR family regulator